MAEKNVKDKRDSSFEMLWNQAFQELDAWVERANYREDVMIQSAKQFAENLKRNQANLKELTEQFSQEIREWEKTSREELLTTTTGLQFLFPVKSYEEVNKQLDQLQDKREEFVSIPVQSLLDGERVDYFVTALEQYIEFRRKNRNLYVKNMKESASIIKDNQRAILNIMSNQMKNVLFPFNKYMERANELAKS
ncbi:MAG TPA: hypothetical protein VEY51_12235 [Chondromyces sp.]|nr:hypothetical protein [Chondromyces sp.]